VNRRPGRVLVVAGSDSGGGAGLQADIRTITRLGGYAMTAVTAVTVQNTLGVFAVETMPAWLVADQMRTVLDDIGADAIKIGMLATGEIATAAADMLDRPAASGIPVVLDTVLISSSGRVLLDDPGIDVLRRRLLPKAWLITPNLPEAEALTGAKIADLDAMERAAAALLDLGARNVLVKGGHLLGDDLLDLLVGEDGRQEFRHARVHTRHTHGTGCTLASAIAVRLAQGHGLTDAVATAIAHVQAALSRAPGFGDGNGPLG
jgi:hydroxymethylpyrimidine/phosphomethylpyrimidine kinase